MSTYRECREEINAFGYTQERRVQQIKNLDGGGYKLSFPYPGNPENEYAAIYRDREIVTRFYPPER